MLPEKIGKLVAISSANPPRIRIFPVMSQRLMSHEPTSIIRIMSPGGISRDSIRRIIRISKPVSLIVFWSTGYSGLSG
jgi:hypothetical protein